MYIVISESLMSSIALFFAFHWDSWFDLGIKAYKIKRLYFNEDLFILKFYNKEHNGTVFQRLINCNIVLIMSIVKIKDCSE